MPETSKKTSAPLVAMLVLAAFAFGILSARMGIFPATLFETSKTEETGTDNNAGGRTVAGKAKGKQSPMRGGRWARAREGTGLTDQQRQELAVVPYMQGVKRAEGADSVLAHDPETAHQGLNLVVSGHGPEAFLMDMDGAVLHRWRRDYQSVWNESVRGRVNTTYWRRAHLFPNGDLLAIFEGVGLIKVDKDSKLLWAYKGKCHHDMQVADDGTIYTLGRRLIEKHHDPWLDGKIIEDFVVTLSPDGKPLSEVSIVDAILASKYAAVLARRTPNPDILHTNTIELLDGAHAARFPMLRKGHVLLSMRTIDMVAVLDLEQRVVTWAMTEMWRQQHQPTVMKDGHLLVFDNQGHGGKSRVIEIDPLTHDIVWSYDGTPEEPLYSKALGSCQRLPNGNTLITESEPGRAVEITPDKTIAWEYVNPFRAGARGELIASLFEVVRIETAYPRFAFEPGAGTHPPGK